MAVTPIQYVFQAIDKSTGAVKSGVNVKITNDGGWTFLPSASGVNTDANGVAIINVSAIGSYDVYLDGTISTDYQSQTVIPLENNKIRGVDTDETFNSINTGTIDATGDISAGDATFTGGTIEIGTSSVNSVYHSKRISQFKSDSGDHRFFDSSGSSSLVNINETGVYVFQELDMNGNDIKDAGAGTFTGSSNGVLTVTGAALDAQIKLERTGSASGTGYIGANSINSFIVYNDSLTKVYELSQSGNASFTGNIQTGTPSVTNNGQAINADGTRNSYRSGTALSTHNAFNNDNGTVGSIKTTGTATQFNTSSDPRLKTEFKKPTKTQTWAKFKAIFESFGIFQFKTEPDKDIWGFDAHKIIDKTGDIGSEGNGDRSLELGSLISEAKYETIDIPAVLDEDGKELEPAKTEEKLIKEAEYVTPAGVDQSKVVPYLVACIEDLRKRIEVLESK